MMIEIQKIPKSLRELNQWVNWKLILRPGDKIPTKVPLKPDNTAASSTDPSTWNPIQPVIDASPKFTGIGFVFTPSDPYCGIDFDACRDKQTGKIADWASKWITKLDSYAEISPSGTGVKVWVKAKSPMVTGKKRKLPEYQTGEKTPAIEVYDFGRFFAVTGWRYDKFPPEPQDRQPIVNDLCSAYFPPDIPTSGNKISSPLTTIDRARKYIDKIPGAISGNGGHDQTFHVSCILVLGFGLSQNDAFILLSEYNNKCDPKWNTRELKHKIESAGKQSGERNYLRDAQDSEWDSIKIPEYKLPEGTPTYEKQEKKFEESGEGIYRLILPEIGISFEIDRLRRESHELIGELAVKCTLSGVRTYDGNLSIADFNLSSARARTDRAKLLGTRANIEGVDWTGYLEEFCQRVLNAERRGQSAVDLRTLERPAKDDALVIKGVKLPKRHPSIIFGDGGSAKSYIALYFAGQLSNRGMNVGLFDWELAGEDHRDRLERMYGKQMPKIIYARCERALTYEIDRIRRIANDEKIDYAIFDSVAFACSGPPESAEIAGAYFRALRQINCGSLHVAHVTKAYEGADQKPFGSVFWHNGARATYFIKLVDDSSNIMHLGVYNRKANLERLQPPSGFRIEFTDDGTFFQSENPADTQELAQKMSVRDRMKALLRYGSMDLDKLADELDVKRDTIYKTVKRNDRSFTLIDGGKVGLISNG